ncbi:unnamed protein product [Cylicocyclus nassatus]|uniref:EF-hand domain-containing protein n=1 Tax=Cylicocyclus nassatus TaxID=53992 RepID=A0AA36DLZ4_CYLNA|nr:unnamed protein product [Cylicocyclus nassatus]
MLLYHSLLIALLLLAEVVHNAANAQDNTKGTTRANHKHAHKRRKFAEKSEVQDTEHLALHLQHRINIDPEKMTEEQKRFHYFSIYDLDGNRKLDGLEIMKSMFHDHDQAKLPTMKDEEIEKMVDAALEDFDINGNGFIEYSEYRAKMLE